MFSRAALHRHDHGPKKGLGPLLTQGLGEGGGGGVPLPDHPLLEGFETRHVLWLHGGGRRLLGRDRLTAAQSLYLKMALTGMEDKYTRYVMVDEVQDYTEAQLMVLSRYYRTARFMMLGDENQAIVPDRVAFSAMNDITTSGFSVFTVFFIA